MKDWFLEKVNELGEKAVDSVVNIVLSRNDKTIADFKQTPLITAISRSVNAHIVIKQPNLASAVDTPGSGPRIGLVQVDLLESSFLLYPVATANGNGSVTPGSVYSNKTPAENQKSRVYFEGLGSIPAGMCRYSVSMTCNGRVAYSPPVEMANENINRVRWNHQFIAELDDLWVDLGLVVHAEIDFNQFSQQQSRYNSPRKGNVAKRIPGVRCTQVSRSEAAEWDPAEAQQVTSIYGKTKYMQRIGRALISLPVLLDSTELRCTSQLRNGVVYSAIPTPTDEDGNAQLLSSSSTDQLPLTPATTMEAVTPNSIPNDRNMTPQINRAYSSKVHQYGMPDRTPTFSGRHREFIGSNPQVFRPTRRIAARETHRRRDLKDTTFTSNTLKYVDDSYGVYAKQGSSESRQHGYDTPNRQASLDVAVRQSSPQVPTTPSVGCRSKEYSEIQHRGIQSYKTCAEESDGDVQYPSSEQGTTTTDKVENPEVGTQQKNGSTQANCKQNVIGNVCDGMNASRRSQQDAEMQSDSPFNSPMRSDTESFPDVNHSTEIPNTSLERRGSSTSADVSSVGIAAVTPIDMRRGVYLDGDDHPVDGTMSPIQLVDPLQTPESVTSEYRHFTETVMTLQLLPFNEHKWDNEKFIRPIEGYPTYGMKTPTHIQGYIKVRVRVYLTYNPKWLAITSNVRHPKTYWQVPKEMEMLHVGLILRRIELFFSAVPRWVDKILLPRDLAKHPYYVALFWAIVFDIMVLAPFPRIVLDVYLLIGLVSLFYKREIGPMRYTNTGISTGKPTAKDTSAYRASVELNSNECYGENQTPTRNDSNGGHKDQYCDANGQLERTNCDANRAQTNTDIQDVIEAQSLKAKSLTTSMASDKPEISESKELSIWDFKGREESSSTLITPFGERELCIQHKPGAHRTALFADDLGDTNFEEIVKLTVVLLQLAQVIMGYFITIVEKLRISLAFTDSLSWMLTWTVLTVLFIPLYALVYISWRVPLVLWRLTLYSITFGYCMSFNSPGEGLISVVFPYVRSLMWAWLKRSLWYANNWIHRVPDSREIDHRSVSMLQVV